MSFLPQDYDVPESSSRYMKLKPGDNRFRVLDSPVIGYEYWVYEKDTSTPIRVKTMDEAVNAENYLPTRGDGKPNQIKHFWAMPVINYATGKVEILEITQKSIQKTIKELAQDEDWGDPRQYDIAITRQGEGLETEYSVVPKPNKPLSTEHASEWAKLKPTVNLEALFDGGDPFGAATSKVASSDVSDGKEDGERGVAHYEALKDEEIDLSDIKLDGEESV